MQPYEITKHNYRDVSIRQTKTTLTDDTMLSTATQASNLDCIANNHM